MNQGSSSRVLVTCGDLNDVIAQGIVMDLASAGLPPSVAGIVGLNILSQYDVEFHFLKEQIAFYAVGAANRGDCDMQGLQKLALAPVQYALPGLQVRYNSDLVYVLYVLSIVSWNAGFVVKIAFILGRNWHLMQSTNNATGRDGKRKEPIGYHRFGILSKCNNTERSKFCRCNFGTSVSHKPPGP